LSVGNRICRNKKIITFLRVLEAMILKDDDSKMWFKDNGASIWGKTELRKIKKGDRFKVYTLEGKPFVIKGCETYIAASDPYLIKGVWAVKVNL